MSLQLIYRHAPLSHVRLPPPTPLWAHGPKHRTQCFELGGGPRCRGRRHTAVGETQTTPLLFFALKSSAEADISHSKCRGPAFYFICHLFIATLSPTAACPPPRDTPSGSSPTAPSRPFSKTQVAFSRRGRHGAMVPSFFHATNALFFCVQT